MMHETAPVGTVDFNLFQPREETRTASLSCMAAVASGYLVPTALHPLLSSRYEYHLILHAKDAGRRGLHV